MIGELGFLSGLALLVILVGWWFWRSGGPPPKDRDRHTRQKDYMGRDI